MKKNIILGIMILGITLTIVGCEKNGIKKKEVNAEQPTVSKINNKKIDKKIIIKELTSDKYEGRLVGTKGNKLTEEYLFSQFENLELKPVLGNGLYHKYEQEVTEKYGIVNESEIKEVNNIIGKIDNEKKKNAIIISAHFDHIGRIDNNIIPGAIDNASGISILLDLAANLKGENLESDIIFCAFNGEENGLNGSKKFVEDIKKEYENIININIDSVGYKNGGDIVFFERKNYEKIYSLMEESLKVNDIKVNDVNLKGIADSKSFEQSGIPNICLIDENAKDVIHTIQDTEEQIDYKKLDNLVESINNFIKNYKF